MSELKELKKNLRFSLTAFSSMLIKESKRRDKNFKRHKKNCEVVTAILYALSPHIRKSQFIRQALIFLSTCDVTFNFHKVNTRPTYPTQLSMDPTVDLSVTVGLGG